MQYAGRQWIIMSNLNTVEILLTKMPKWHAWKNQVSHFLKNSQGIPKIFSYPKYNDPDSQHR